MEDVLSDNHSDNFFAAVVIDHSQALRFALNIARGMSYLHSLDPLVLRLVAGLFLIADSRTTFHWFTMVALLDMNLVKLEI